MTNPTSLIARIVQLEEVFAHQEQLVGQLNEVILDLRNELDAMKQNQNEQSVRLKWLVDNTSSEPRTLEDEKPPHY